MFVFRKMFRTYLMNDLLLRIEMKILISWKIEGKNYTGIVFYIIQLAFTSSKLTYFTPCSSVSIVNFEHVIAGWECISGQLRFSVSDDGQKKSIQKIVFNYKNKFMSFSEVIHTSFFPHCSRPSSEFFWKVLKDSQKISRHDWFLFFILMKVLMKVITMTESQIQ